MARTLVYLIFLVTASHIVADDRPNIVFIMADDHAYQAISAYDDRLVSTPHIDRLAAEGIRFDRAFSANSLSGPAMATLMTGTFGHVHGVRTDSGELESEQSSLPMLFQNHGYLVARFGDDAVDEATGWLARQTADAPFLLLMNIGTPMDPNQATESYLAGISHVDHAAGRLLDALEDLGKSQTTLVIFTSDQGLSISDEGPPGTGSMQDPSFRTPLIMRWPGRIEAGGQREALVQNIDFAPTLLDVAGVDIPDEMQGESLAPLFGADDRSFRDAVYYHYYEYPGIHGVKRHYGVRTHRYKLIRFYHNVEEWELYDLKKDPAEMKNLFNNPQYLMAREAMLLKLRVKQHLYGDSPELAQKILEEDLARAAD